ncbi:MAG TPA: cytochrome c biogenesis protein CcdA [Methylomirabilota bacterium]|jgi:cytochrome c-type biogenesis protein|nr:cytochrome c biogenesis protein CcdA [Methylomirabilota bacterium]
MQSVSMLVAFSAGIFSFLSPCVLPLFPSYLSFITGMSLDQLQHGASRGAERRQVIGHSLAFILGFSMVFIGMGASFSALGQLLIEQRDLIRQIGGVLIIVFGLYIAGALPLGWLGRYRQFQLRSKPAGYVGSWLVGVTFAIGWTPCVGPILGSILSLAGTAETVSTGIALLGAYSAGLALPFFLSSLALGAFLVAFQRFRPWIPIVERTAGVVLVIVGILVLTNYFIVLNSYAIGLTPEWLLKRL